MAFAYYNEIDPQACAWLRELINDGLIPDGLVDDRSIVEVLPSELSGFSQHHFFAGIGGWAYALRLANWPDDREVWTGSCPCQPFSTAGKGAGFDDARHLWPEWYRLIRECRPATIFGEQVSSKAGLGWFDLVHAELEMAGYAVGAADLAAAGVGAPHIRQRLYFGAQRLDQPDSARRIAGRIATEAAGHGSAVITAGCEDEWLEHSPLDGWFERWPESGERGAVGGRSEVWMAESYGRDAFAEREPGSGQQRQQSEDSRVDGLADAECPTSDAWRSAILSRESDGAASGGIELGRCGDLSRVDNSPNTRHDSARQHFGGSSLLTTRSIESESSFWSDALYLPCLDGRSRPTQPGIFPLASGVPSRVALLRGAGNAIVPQVAQAFIEAWRAAVE